MPRKLHIGGQVEAVGWEVLDVNPGPKVDHVRNAGDLQCFPDGTFAEIYASHVVEHFDYKNELLATLKEWRRVMIPGGTLYVSVPDLDVLARLFIDRERLSFQDRFLVMRMIFGGHIDKNDYHLVGLNEEFLTDLLRAAGFTEIRKVDGFGYFNDTSLLALRGVPISLNIVCVKPH
jgi:predicted SAM-dependent methyltransferase